MNSAANSSGQCLCGAVRFAAQLTNHEIGACHCSMCRQWAGGVFLAVEAGTVEFSAQDTLGVYPSSEWAERCFCTRCGSSLIWRSKDGTGISVAVAALDNAEDYPLTTQIFIDEKPAGYSFCESTRNMTAAEVIAQFGEGSAS